MKPTRPTPIVAAAVLLISVGAQLVLAALLFGFTMLVWPLFPFVRLMPCSGCIGFGLASLMAVIGFDFLRIGIDLLDGTLKDAGRPAYRIGAIGAMAVSVAVGWVGLLLVEATLAEEPLQFLAKSLPLIVPIWFDAGATLVAGILHRKHSRKYLVWQKEYTKPAEPSGYEDEE